MKQRDRSVWFIWFYGCHQLSVIICSSRSRNPYCEAPQFTVEMVAWWLWFIRLREPVWSQSLTISGHEDFSYPARLSTGRRCGPTWWTPRWTPWRTSWRAAWRTASPRWVRWWQTVLLTLLFSHLLWRQPAHLFWRDRAPEKTRRRSSLSGRWRPPHDLPWRQPSPGQWRQPCLCQGAETLLWRHGPGGETTQVCGW